MYLVPLFIILWILLLVLVDLYTLVIQHSLYQSSILS